MLAIQIDNYVLQHLLTYSLLAEAVWWTTWLGRQIHFIKVFCHQQDFSTAAFISLFFSHIVCSRKDFHHGELIYSLKRTFHQRQMMKIHRLGEILSTCADSIWSRFKYSATSLKRNWSNGELLKHVVVADFWIYFARYTKHTKYFVCLLCFQSDFITEWFWAPRKLIPTCKSLALPIRFFIWNSPCIQFYHWSVIWLARFKPSTGFNST